jgi:hypothetical protein
VFADVASARITLLALPNHGLAWLTAGGDSIVVADSSGRFVRAIALPDSIGWMRRARHSPDHQELIFAAIPTRPGEELVSEIYRVSLVTGAIRLVTRQVLASWIEPPVMWTSDGWFHVSFATSQDLVNRLYRVRVTGGTFERERDLPPEDEFISSMSADGRRMIGVYTKWTSDIHLMRGVERIWRR